MQAKRINGYGPTWSKGSGGRLCSLWGIVASILLAAVVPGRLSAQTTGGEAYRIGSGDVLRVEVTGHPDLSRTVTVDDQGGVTLASVGWVRAIGRTTNDLATDVARRVSLTQRDAPQVLISVVESRSQKIFVLGAVLIPGAYTFAQEPGVWEAISNAGGPSDDADLSAVEVIPGATSDRPASTLDVAAAIRAGSYSSLPRLKPGDTVRVPRLGGFGGEAQVVFLLGAVSAQGPRPLTPPGDLMSVVTASAPAGDADLGKIQIVRRIGGRITQMQVDAREYLSEARQDGNPQLHAGDTIYVPRQTRRFSPLSLIGIVSPIIGLVTSIVVLAR